MAGIQSLELTYAMGVAIKKKVTARKGSQFWDGTEQQNGKAINYILISQNLWG